MRRILNNYSCLVINRLFIKSIGKEYGKHAYIYKLCDTLLENAYEINSQEK